MKKVASLPEAISKGGKWIKWSNCFGAVFLTMFLRPILPYSFPFHFIHSFLFIFYAFLFVSYSLPIHSLFIFNHFCSFPLTWETYQNSKKARIMFFLSISYLKTIDFKPQINWGKGVPHKSPKKWLIKGVVNKVLGLDGLFISYSMLIHFLFKFYSCPIQLLFRSHSFLFILVPFISKGFQ